MSRTRAPEPSREGDGQVDRRHGLAVADTGAGDGEHADTARLLQPLDLQAQPLVLFGGERARSRQADERRVDTMLMASRPPSVVPFYPPRTSKRTSDSLSRARYAESVPTSMTRRASTRETHAARSLRGRERPMRGIATSTGTLVNWRRSSTVWNEVSNCSTSSTASARGQHGQEEAHDQQAQAVRRARPRRWDGRFQNPESLSLVLRFHALGELGLFVPLEQRLVLLSGGLVIARQATRTRSGDRARLPGAVRPSRWSDGAWLRRPSASRARRPGCRSCGRRSGAGVGGAGRRRSAPRPGASGGVPASALERRDFVLDSPDVGMLVGEAVQLRQVALQFLQP